MVRETSRSARLITGLLRIARLDQGEPLPAGDADLLQICRDEVDRLSLLAPELEIGLDVACPPPVHLPRRRRQLRGDPQQPRATTPAGTRRPAST